MSPLETFMLILDFSPLLQHVFIQVIIQIIIVIPNIKNYI